MKTNIPPRTMRDVSRERKNPKNQSLVKISFGTGSIRKSNPNDEESYNIESHRYKKSAKKPIKRNYPKQKLQYELQILENFNSNGDLGIISEFKGINFLEKNFTKSQNNYRNVYGSDVQVYYTKIQYQNKPGFLILTTIEDVLELEIVPEKKGINQMFYDEILIPELTNEYSSISMQTEFNNGIIILSYQKTVN